MEGQRDRRKEKGRTDGEKAGGEKRKGYITLYIAAGNPGFSL